MGSSKPASIWEKDENGMTWYDYATGHSKSKPRPLHRIKQAVFDTGSSSVRHSQWEEDHAWYYEVKEQDRLERLQSTSSDDGHIVTSISVQQPVQALDHDPSVPKRVFRDDPYFEYMFADAGLDVQNSHNDSHAPNSEDATPNSPGVFDAAESPPEFPPSTPPQYPKIVPGLMVVEQSAAIETFLPPELFEPSPTYYSTQDFQNNGGLDFFIPEVDDVFMFGSDTVSDRKILQPKSQKAKAAQSFLDAALSSVCPLIYKQSPRVTRAPITDEIKVVKKRTVQMPNAGVEGSVSDRKYGNEDDAEYLYAKKVRRSLNASLRDLEIETLLHPSGSSLAFEGTNSRSSSGNFFKQDILVTPPKGYPGQFDGMLIDHSGNAVFYNEKTHQEIIDKPPLSSAKSQTFGYRSHPNGLFTHCHFLMDSVAECPNYTESHIPESHPLRTCISHAYDMTILASANIHQRTKDETTFRRQAHIECSSARLEGVSVGYLRYLQGNYSIAEYHHAGMCVCWDFCQCSKMCTRFADLKCPCHRFVTVHGDD